MKLLHLTALALSASQASALSAKAVIYAINEITDLSSKTADIAVELKPNNLVQNLPQLTSNFRNIIQLALKDITNMAQSSGKTDFSTSDQTDICTAFHDFVKIHQNLLSIIIGKNGFLAKSPLTIPLAGVLRALEGGVDTLALSIIKTVPTCKAMAQKDLDDLDATLDDAVGKLSSAFPGLNSRGVNDPKGPVHPGGGDPNGHVGVVSNQDGDKESASTGPPARTNSSSTESRPHGSNPQTSQGSLQGSQGTAAQGARLASDGSTGGLLGGLLPKGNRVAVVEGHLV